MISNLQKKDNDDNGEINDNGDITDINDNDDNGDTNDNDDNVDYGDINDNGDNNDSDNNDDIGKKKVVHTKNMEMMATQMTPTTPPGNTGKS